MLLADPHLKLPRTYQWNVALEQSIGNNQSISATYVGAIGRQLLRVTNLFNVNPNFEFIALTDNSATSDYNALQIKFQRRLSRGLQALGSYSWSHSIDIASTDAIATNINTPGKLLMPTSTAEIPTLTSGMQSLRESHMSCPLWDRRKLSERY